MNVGLEGRDLDVAIVGTGFSGLGMAVQLLHDKQANFAVFERGEAVGGTWRDNSYPGCACDVYSNLYSFSFAPNPNWKGNYGTRAELVEYLEGVARDFGVTPYIRFQHEVLSAHWDDWIQRWRIETSKGFFQARVLVSAMGYLSDANVPNLPGLESFEGTTFHSSRWNHDYDLGGKKVAVIGTGASAIQFVPEIQPIVAQLDLYQRTPPWVAHKPNKANRGLNGFLTKKVPAYQTARRGFNQWGREVLVFAMSHEFTMSKVQKMSEDHLKKEVKDASLREKLRPAYVSGCKRMLFSNTYYESLTRPSSDVITSGIREVRPNSIITEDGTEHATDAIIFGTGFRVTSRPVAERVWGRNGKHLADVWSGEQSAYLGSAIPGFPNFFTILGPNTALGHSSMTLMSEAQISYVGDFVRKLTRQPIGAVDVKPEVSKAFNEQVQTWAKGKVWSFGKCKSWYLDANGKNTTVWPTYTWRFRKLTRRFNLDDYIVEPPTPPQTLQAHVVEMVNATGSLS